MNNQRGKINWQLSLPIPVLIVVIGFFLWKNLSTLENDFGTQQATGFDSRDCNPNSPLWHTLQQKGHWDQVQNLADFCLDRDALKMLPATTREAQQPQLQQESPQKQQKRSLPRRPPSVVPQTRGRTPQGPLMPHSFMPEDCRPESGVAQSLQNEGHWESLKKLGEFCTP